MLHLIACPLAYGLALAATGRRSKGFLSQHDSLTVDRCTMFISSSCPTTKNSRAASFRRRDYPEPLDTMKDGQK
ncbi:hypothetical protein M440DRAFT_1406608 [Trichoderma longibrachiatum ATCC 18648]|uniref:Secreted protein n=1 Tax=Trichoderma longibrachiatum ATCC 18648 TaxID=983965 RepID=A0A2T4BQ24_TRILO|nr:hypothetical protein M440DRAFT_1406608 [Trichoderma longibrachiatum ATCC 18648]